MREQEKKLLKGEIICCGNHVFKVINGQRYWISKPPDDWETIDGRIWNE